VAWIHGSQTIQSHQDTADILSEVSEAAFAVQKGYETQNVSTRHPKNSIRTEKHQEAVGRASLQQNSQRRAKNYKVLI